MSDPTTHDDASNEIARKYELLNEVVCERVGELNATLKKLTDELDIVDPDAPKPADDSSAA